jgi:hypothetical protein
MLLIQGFGGLGWTTADFIRRGWMRQMVRKEDSKVGVRLLS